MERWGENTIYYYYDESGVSGFRYNNTDYYYHKNIFGDVVAIYDVNGNLQCTYDYDAWGNHTVTNATDANIGNVNPIRYRSYYWDREFNLYYLQSRYYDPALCRFISPDSIDYLEPETIGGLNLYAYCNNNPVKYCDPSGHSVVLALILAGTFAVGFGSSLLINAATNDWQLDWRDFAQAGIDGLFAMGSTVLAMTGIGFWASVGIGAAMGWSQYALGTAVQGGNLTWSGSLTAIGFGALGGAISGAGAANTRNIANNMVGLSDDGARAISAITNAANRKIAGQISQKGFQGVVNLYGKTAFNAVQAAIPGTMRMLFMQAARNIAIYTPISNIVSGGLNYGYGVWGWI